METRPKSSQPQEDEIDLIKIFHLLLKDLHLIVLTAFIGAVIGYGVYKSTNQNYLINSTVLIDSDESSVGLGAMFDGSSMLGMSNNNNETTKHEGILRSYKMIRSVVDNLDLDVQKYKTHILKKQEIFGDTPFKVELLHKESNVSFIEVEITTTEENKLKLIGEGKLVGNVDIEINKEFQYGQKIITPYFSAIISCPDINELEEDQTYTFVFTDAAKVALDYQSRIQISETIQDGQLLTLSLEGSCPEKEVAFLNELFRVYANYDLESKNLISKNTIEFIDFQLSGISDSLSSTSSEFANFRSTNQAIDLSKSAEIAIESFKDLETQKREAELRLRYYKNLATYIDDSEKMQSVSAPSLVGIDDVNLTTIIQQLSEGYTQYETLSYGMTDKNPTLRQLKNDIKTLRNLLKENLSNLSTNTKNEVDNINNQLEEMEGKIANLPQTEQKMISLQRNYTLNNELFTYLQQSRAEAAVTMAANSSDCKLIDKAELSTAISKGPKLLLLIIIGGFLGGVLRVGILFIKSIFDTRIKTLEDFDHITTLPILDSIGHNPFNDVCPIKKQPRSAFTESLRSIRTNLNFMVPKDETPVIAIHSTVPGEGKSFCSLNVASIFAMNKNRVLLVGLDLRKPQLHNYLNTVTPKKGMTTFLIGQDNFNDIIEHNEEVGIDIAFSGPIPPNPAELLESDMLLSFLNLAKKEYDVIILDNAPFSIVTDGIITSKYADLNLIVARQGVSKKEQFKLINQLEVKETIQNIAILPNDFKVTTAYGYNTYSGYTSNADHKGYYDDPEEEQNIIKRIFKSKKGSA